MTLAKRASRPDITWSRDWILFGIIFHLEDQFPGRQTPKAFKAMPSPSKVAVGGRVYLNCPYSQKEQAKSLGARWDQNMRRWYVCLESNVDVAKFQRWLPQGFEASRATSSSTNIPHPEKQQHPCVDVPQQFGSPEMEACTEIFKEMEAGELEFASPAISTVHPVAQANNEKASGEKKRKSRKDKKYATPEEKRAARIVNNKKYRMNIKKKLESVPKNVVHQLPVHYCPPNAESMEIFRSTSSVIDARSWGEENFDGLVEEVIMELSQSGKCMCLGRIFYDAPNPAQATKRFIQPGYARVPKPISANALNYVVFEWFPCVTPEMDVISGEILMEYICDQCKLAIAMYVIHQISICFVHSFFFARASLWTASMVKQEPQSNKDFFTINLATGNNYAMCTYRLHPRCSECAVEYLLATFFFAKFESCFLCFRCNITRMHM